MSVGGVNFNNLASTIGSKTDKVGQELANLQASGDTTSTSDMLKMQQKMQEWSMLTQLQSTIIKELGDALKGIVQKSG
ncbi:MAG: EscF/YscF/HrpA family type III secretion system needle major subunit [Dongiaceae bacterium]